MRRDGAVTGNSVLIALEMLQDEAFSKMKLLFLYVSSKASL